MGAQGRDGGKAKVEAEVLPEDTQQRCQEI
jgi:hypothetical protein